MNEAIWHVAGAALYVVFGALVALYVLLAILMILFDGNRTERGRALGGRGVFTRNLFTHVDDVDKF